MRLSEIQKAIGGELFLPTELPIQDPEIMEASTLELADSACLALCADKKHETLLSTTRAGAVIVKRAHSQLARAQLIHAEPAEAFAAALRLLYPAPERMGGIHPSAVVSPQASIGADVRIEANAVVEAGARIGARVTLAAGCHIGAGTKVGEDSFIHPRVVVLPSCVLGRRVIVHPGTVIGADGFGYRWEGNGHRKIPQVGTVVIEDDVEIGANCTVDRATVGETRIGTGSKLDNMVHVGHNVVIGPHCILVAQVGVSGSVRMGRRVLLAGQVGVADHAELEDEVVVAAKSGVHGKIEKGETVAGYPIQPVGVWRRVSAALPRLPELLRRVRRLEQEVGLDKK